MADIREQAMTVKTTLADTDKLRVVTATSNETITIKQLEDTRGITQAKSDISQLQTDVGALQSKTLALIDGMIDVSKKYYVDYSGASRTGLIDHLIALFNAAENGSHGYSGAWQGKYYIGGNFYKIANNIGIITLITATGNESSKIFNAGGGWNEALL